jgi:hypothetical protein
MVMLTKIRGMMGWEAVPTSTDSDAALAAKRRVGERGQVSRMDEHGGLPV